MSYPVDYGLNYGSAPGMQAPAFAFPSMDLSSGGASIAGAVPSAAKGFQFGMNAPSFQMGMQGLNSLGNLWGAFQAQKLAREQFDFTKNTTNTNMNNSIKSYNTTLEDRARSRGFTEGQSSGQIQGYIDNNRLTR